MTDLDQVVDLAAGADPRDVERRPIDRRVRAYFDIGNVAISGYAHDWIRTLGKRIVKLHIKDFSFRKNVASFSPLLEGDIDFKAVHAALLDIGYKGTATLELGGGDAAYLKEVSNRFEKILTGA